MGGSQVEPSTEDSPLQISCPEMPSLRPAREPTAGDGLAEGFAAPPPHTSAESWAGRLLCVLSFESVRHLEDPPHFTDEETESETAEESYSKTPLR